MKIKMKRYKVEEHPLASISQIKTLKTTKKIERPIKVVKKTPYPNSDLEGLERKDYIVKAVSRRMLEEAQRHQPPLTTQAANFQTMVEVVEEITALLNTLHNSIEYIDENLRQSQGRYLRIEIERQTIEDEYRKSQRILLVVFTFVVFGFFFVIIKLISQ